MYDTILGLLVNYLGVSSGSMPYDVCQVLATVACVFVLVIPFLIVYKVICIICGR